MAKKKISDAEAEVIKDAIIDALETNDEVATEEVAIDEVAIDEVATEEVAIDEVAEEVAPTEVVPTVEVILNVPAPEVESPGHHSRDFKA